MNACGHPLAEQGVLLELPVEAGDLHRRQRLQDSLVSEPLKLPDGELGWVSDGRWDADTAPYRRRPNAIPVEDIGLEIEAGRRDGLQRPSSTLAAGPISVIEEEEAVHAGHLRDQVETSNLGRAKTRPEGGDDVPDPGRIEPGDIERPLHHEEMLGGLGLVGGFVVEDRVVEVVQLQALLESRVGPPLAVPVGLLLGRGPAHVAEDDWTKLAVIAFLKSTNLEDDPVVQGISPAAFPRAPIQVASAQLAVDLGGDPPSSAEPVARGELAP